MGSIEWFISFQPSLTLAVNYRNTKIILFQMVVCEPYQPFWHQLGNQPFQSKHFKRYMPWMEDANHIDTNNKSVAMIWVISLDFRKANFTYYSCLMHLKLSNNVINQQMHLGWSRKIYHYTIDYYSDRNGEVGKKKGKNLTGQKYRKLLKGRSCWQTKEGWSSAPSCNKIPRESSGLTDCIVIASLSQYSQGQDPILTCATEMYCKMNHPGAQKVLHSHICSQTLSLGCTSLVRYKHRNTWVPIRGSEGLFLERSTWKVLNFNPNENCLTHL